MPLSTRLQHGKFRRFFFLMALGLVVALMAHLASCRSAGKGATSPCRVTIGVPVQMLAAMVLIAKEKEYFQQEGIQAELKEYPSGKEALDGLEKGEIDLACASETQFVVKAAGEANNLRILATIATTDNDAGIVARRDRGIKAPADLRGKTIATARGSSGHYFLHCFLAEQYIAESDVTLMFLEPRELAPALARGEVDAVSMYEPYLWQAQQVLADQAVSFSSAGLYTKTFNLVVKLTSGKPPDFSDRILKSMARSEEFVATRADDAMNIVAREIKLPADLVARLWKDSIFSLSLNQSLLLMLESERKWSLQAGLGKPGKMIPVVALVEEHPLRSVSPQAVSIIKEGFPGDLTR